MNCGSLKRGILAMAASVVTVVACDSGTVSREPGSKEPAMDSMAAIEQQASQGVTESQIILARKLMTGDGVSKNVEKACEWYMRAGNAGSTDGMVESAKCFRDEVIGYDYKKAESWWKRAAEAGSAEAQYEYATTMTFVGREGVFIFGEKSEQKKNLDNFLLWIGKSSEKKYPPAMYALGMGLLVGVQPLVESAADNLVAIDRPKGAGLVKAAADLGYWQAQWATAVLYQEGFKPIAANTELSNYYWDLLDKQTSVEAIRGIGDLYSADDPETYKAGKNKYRGRKLSFDETNKLAFEWYSRAAEEKDPDSLLAIAKMYANGHGVWKDQKMAAEYLRQAADLGSYGAMRRLAYAYVAGDGVVKDYAEAFRWTQRAVGERESSDFGAVHKTRAFLGAFYENGWGIDADPVLAYAWYNISVAGGYDAAKEDLDRIEQVLTKEQLAEAQKISREWHPGRDLIRLQSSASVTGTGQAVVGQLTQASSGSAFYISSEGQLLTNFHVVDKCKELRIPAEGDKATVVVSDLVNDLAVINATTKISSRPAITLGRGVSQGEQIFVFGYPLDGYLPASGNITPGIISALAGPANNSSLIQLTAPVQPGNSGGPVLNAKGELVGIVVGKADAIRIANITGDIPQNVNFAISLQTVRAFLDSNRIQYTSASSLSFFDKNAVEIADLARARTVKIECWR